MPKSKEPTFEFQLKRLEKVVAHLESGVVSLEESLKLFEEGITLARACQNILTKTRQKVEILIPETGELKSYDA